MTVEAKLKLALCLKMGCEAADATELIDRPDGWPGLMDGWIRAYGGRCTCASETKEARDLWTRKRTS